jgi:NAD(P)-dependent dehydrogenase (short-subunit alcohol dehydrogenase family)
MARVFITGSTEGLGRAAAVTLLASGHEVVLHARSAERASAVADLVPRAAGLVIGDLASGADVRGIADQVNALGTMDAVIHNAGVYTLPVRGSTPDGHATVVAVNTLAPYLLTAWIQKPRRLVYLSSGLHRDGGVALDDLDWKKRAWNPARAYAESKLHVAALAYGVARRWPEVFANVVDPGWVRTRMGGPSAPVDLDTGQRTQTWLATSDEPRARVSGRYWHHMREETPAAAVEDPAFQDRVLAHVADLTGVDLP